MQVFSKKRSSKMFFRRSQKKGLQKIFSSEKGLQKICFRQSLLEETKKKVFAHFPQGFWRFPTKFKRFKNSAVHRAIFEDLKLRSQGLQNVYSRPRTFLRTPPLCITACVIYSIKFKITLTRAWGCNF